MKRKGDIIAILISMMCIVINLFTIGAYNPLQGILMIGFCILVGRKTFPFLNTLSWFSERKNDCNYNHNIDDNIKSMSMNIIKKSQYKIITYIAEMTLGIYIIGLILSVAANQWIKLQSKIYSDAYMYIPYLVYLMYYVIYYIFNKLFYFEPLKIEYDYSKKIVEYDNKNIRAHYDIALINAYYGNAEECFDELRKVVQLDKKYKDLIKDDNRFGKGNISNLDEFKKIVYKDPIEEQNSSRADYLSR